MSIIICLDLATFCRYTPNMARTGRPKKKAAESKTDYIEVRCEESEKQAFRQAAEAVGLPLSGWIRERLRRAARKELEDMDMPVAFLERLTA
jgi:mobilization protein NikA